MISFAGDPKKKVVSSEPPLDKPPPPPTAAPKPPPPPPPAAPKPWAGLNLYKPRNPAKKPAPKKGGARTRRRPVAVADMAELRIVNGVPVLNRRLHAVTNSSGRTRVTECRRKNYTMGTRRKSKRKSNRR